MNGDIVAAHMPFGIGLLPYFPYGIVIPVGPGAGVAEPVPGDPIGRIFRPMEVAVAIVFGLEDLAEGEYGAGQTGEVYTFRTSSVEGVRDFCVSPLGVPEPCRLADRSPV